MINISFSKNAFKLILHLTNLWWQIRWLLRSVGGGVWYRQWGRCDDAEDPDEPAAIVDLISAAKDSCEDTEARLDLRGEELVEQAAARLDLRADGPVAGDELDSDEDLLLDVREKAPMQT